MPPDDDVDLSDVEQLKPDTNGEPDEPDEQEPDEPDQQDEDVEEEPELETKPDRKSRGETRISALNDRLRQAEERERESTRRLDEILRQRQQAQPQGETATQREERRSRLTPEERVTEDIRDSERRMSQQLQGMQFNSWESQDRALYETKASINPRYRRWQDRVEKEIAQMRERGQVGVSREAVYFYLIGKSMEEQAAGKGGDGRRQQAARRVQANTTRTGNTRSDATASRRGTGKSLEERLSDTPI